MIRFISILTCAFLGTWSASQASATDKEWDFSEVRFTPCKGVGITGSYRIHVRANVSTSATGVTLQTLTVTVSSAIFPGNQASIAASLDARNIDGKVVGHTNLASAWFDTISAPGSDLSVYLPPMTSPPTKTTPQRPFSVPGGAAVHLIVSPVVTAGGGTCPLYASDNELSLK